jgi:hypothetical protein
MLDVSIKGSRQAPVIFHAFVDYVATFVLKNERYTVFSAAVGKFGMNYSSSDKRYYTILNENGIHNLIF